MLPPKVVLAGLQSGSIMCLADVGTQLCLEGKSFTTTTTDLLPYDPHRSLRWAAAGILLHGPYFYLGFSKLDQFFGPATTTAATTSIRIVAQKTATAQFILFPPYLVAIFSFMGVLEGCNDIPKKVGARVPETFLSGCIYWPISNGINFALVPATFRVPYLAASAGFWNSYLSWTNAK